MTHRHLSAFSIISLLTLILSSCSSDDAPQPPPSGTGFNLEISSDVLRLAEGAEITGTYYSGDTSTDVTDQMRCTVTAGNAFMFDRYIIGSAPGNETLNCTYNFESKTRTLTINNQAPESAQLVIGDTTLHRGASSQYRFIGLYSDGEQVDYSAYSVWGSTDVFVAAVDNGLVAGIQTGLATISVWNDGVSSGDRILVEVIPGTPQRIEVVQDESFYVGITREFRARGFWDDGDEAWILGADWSSSNDRAVLVDGTRSSFLASAEGEVSISATLEGVTGTKDTEVTAAIVVSVETAPPTKERITTGEILEIQAFATYSDGSVVDISGFADWHESGGGLVEFNTIPGSSLAFMTATNERNTSTTYWADYDGVNGGRTSQIIFLDLPN